MNNLHIAADTDYYKTPILTDDQGRRVRFVAHEIHGTGWTVARVTGSKRAGYTTEPVDGYANTYTMHQAQTAAEALTRDTFAQLRAVHYAVYTESGILGVGQTAEQAVAKSGINAPIVPLDVDSNYKGGIVDFRDAWEVAPDTESAAGADAKLRRCTARLAAEVARGSQPPFTVLRRGELDLDVE